MLIGRGSRAAGDRRAAAYPVQGALQASLEQRRSVISSATGRPVRLELTSAGEVAFALARSHGDPDVESLRASRLRALVDDCGLRHVLGSDSSENLAARPGALGNDRRRPCRAFRRLGPGTSWELLEGLPHLSPRDADFEPALCVLLPPSVRAGWEAGPDCAVGIRGWSYRARLCSYALDEATIGAVEAWTGMPVRCVLCQTLELRMVVAAFVAGQMGMEYATDLSSRSGPVSEAAATGTGATSYPSSAGSRAKGHAAGSNASRGLDGWAALEGRRSPSSGGEGRSAQAAMEAIPLALARIPVDSAHYE